MKTEDAQIVESLIFIVSISLWDLYSFSQGFLKKSLVVSDEGFTILSPRRKALTSCLIVAGGVVTAAHWPL